MAVSENDLVVGPLVPAAGVTTISLDFYFEQAAWLEVYKSGSETPLVLNTDYTVTGAGSGSGVVTLATAANGTDSYSVYLVVPLQRSSDMQLRGEFKSEPFNIEMDRLWQRLQYHWTQINRSLRLGFTQTAETILSAVGAGQLIQMKADGTGFVGYDPDITVSEVTTWYVQRSAANAGLAAGLPDGSIVSIAGNLYQVDATKTGTASATNDLGVDGLKPYGDPVSLATYGVSSSLTAAQNATRIAQALANNGSAGGVFIVPRGANVDWEAVSLDAFSGNTIIGGDGEIIIDTVGIRPAGEQADHIVFQTRRDVGNTTRVYVQPPEWTLGHTGVTSGVVTSFTAFFDAYDDQGAEADTNPDWTGPHYRDGGVSLFADSTPPLGNAWVPEYSPAGLVAFNAKVGGNWWPFRPSAGLSVSEKPLATVFELPPSVALAGPTFAGGGVYPTDRWRPSKAYSAGDICHEYGRVYEVTTGGTSGTTPPLHDGVGGARADAWDASILTTAGTLSGGFYTGTDGGTGGGTVQYALIEQLYPTDMDNVLFLGPALSENPLLGLDDNAVQIGASAYLIGNHQIVAAKRESDGSGTTNAAGLHADFNGAMRFGYSDTKGLLARHNDTDNLFFDGVSVAFDEIVKPSGDATVDVSNASIVKFNDAVATNFTGFTGATQGQVIHLLFNNTNTTLVHGSTLKCPGGANIPTDANDGYTVVMRSATVAQIMS